MKKSILLGGFSAVLFAAGAVYAAPAAAPMKVDADGNGLVSKAEALARADARFARMDANNDGAIDQADRAARIKQRFAKLDADSNGTVSEAEFTALHTARAEKRANRRELRGARGGNGQRLGGRGRRGGAGMKMADANNDRTISQAEFRAAAEARFAKVDTNNDGSISRDERRARKGMRGRRGSMQPMPAMPDAG